MDYDSILQAKVSDLESLLERHQRLNSSSSDKDDHVSSLPVAYEVIASEKQHFRHRCRFQIIHRKLSSLISAAADEEDSRCHAEIVSDHSSATGLSDAASAVKLSYAIWEHGKPVLCDDSYIIPSTVVSRVMPLVLRFSERIEILCHGLEAITFLSTLSGMMMKDEKIISYLI
jgi:hypothetical protein